MGLPCTYRALLEGFVLQPLATHGAAVVWLIRRVTRTPQQHHEADRCEDNERQDERDLALNGEHV